MKTTKSDTDKKGIALYKLPQEVYHILHHNVLQGSRDEDSILFTGVVTKWSKFTIPIAFLVAFVFSFVTAFIQTIMKSQLSPIIMVILLMIMFMSFQRLVHIRYSLFILHNEIAIIPEKTPDKCVLIPMDYLTSINVSKPFLTSGKVSIALNKEFYTDINTKAEHNIILKDAFFIERKSFKSGSSYVQSIINAILESDCADKLLIRIKKS